ncbi:MAG: hypothetical protein WCB96_07720 [Candidatus Aminicenantales bacterium]
MIKMRSGALAWAFFLVLVLPGALWAQEKLKKPAVSQNQSILKWPNITSIEHQHLGDPSGEFILKGTNFTPQGSKKVRVDGVLVTHYYFPWADGSIDIGLPVSYIPWEHVYQFCIVSDGTVVSNVYSQRFLYYYEKLIPNKGPIGTEVRIVPIFCLPASPGELVIKIGTYTMSITSWKAGQWGEIKAKVPAGVPPGEYDVYLQKGSDMVSDKVKFRVYLDIIPAPKPIIKK